MTDRRISRRSLLAGGAGLLAAYAIGCGDDDEAGEPGASPSATAARTPTSVPTTATPAVTPGTMRWRRIEVSGDSPPARRDHSIVVDREYFLMTYGGRNDSGTLGDLWAYDLQKGSWALWGREGEVKPAPRFGHNAVYVGGGVGMVVFGGQAGSSFFNDVWLTDGAGWVQLDPQSPLPPERYGAASALTSDGEMLISHGFTNAGRFDDSWSFPPQITSWTDVSAAGDRPVKRCLCRGAWDSQRNRFLMFGGQTDGTPFLGDTWVFDGAAWTEITSESKPSPRNFYAMAETDPGRIALFGGNSVDGPGPVNDLWFFDSATDTWTLAQPEGEAPSARYGHDAVWVPEARKLIVFGGHDASGDVNDLWELTIPA
jgi:hypothetical protein